MYAFGRTLNMNSRRVRDQHGFTLIELLVVVVIIGILASVAIPNFMGAQDKAKNAAMQANTHSVQMAIEQYAVDNAGVYPHTGQLVSDVVTDKGYMAGGTYPRTPWGGEQAADIAFPFGDETATVSTFINTVTAPNVTTPATVTDYGAISYAIANGATAYDKYDLGGTGKMNNTAIFALYLKNY